MYQNQHQYIAKWLLSGRVSMQTRLAQLSYRLRSGELISLESGASWLVSCRRGHVWLTVSGRTQDIWLTAGQGLTLPDTAKVVIEAVGSAGDSEILLTQPESGRSPMTLPRSTVTPRVSASPERRQPGWLATLRRSLAKCDIWRPARGSGVSVSASN